MKKIKLENIRQGYLALFAVVAVCMAIGFSGCKKLVQTDLPINVVTTGDAFATNQQAAGTVASLYSQLMTNSGNMIFSNGATSVYTGLSSDELVSLSGVATITNYQFETNALTTDNATGDTYFWKPAYHIINDANAIVEGVNASTSILLTDSARRQLVGEAKFVRAYCYFYLTNLYGNVPLALSTDFNVTSRLPNSNQDDVYKQITQDLLDAQGLLLSNYNVSGGEKIRANKWAATALLARVYLYQKDWKDAEAQATAVINSGQFSLVSALANVFNKNSTEAILQWQQNITKTPFSGTYDGKNFIPGLIIYNQTPATIASLIDPSVFPTYAPILVPPFYMSPTMIAAFETNDKRKTTWTGYTPTPVASAYAGANLYWPYKYTLYAGSSTTAATQYYMVLRLAEQYLIRAEARAQQSDIADAAADLNLIRTRAGLPATTAATQSDMLNAISHERLVELFAEGHRWFDLKRTDIAGAVLGAINYKQPFNSYQLLYPIPPNETKADAFLQQNPGY